MTTKERILEAARRLFNAEGTAAVSTNHVAAAAGISPGNLYYHFRNKEEIIRAIFEQLSATWDSLFTLPTDRPPTLDDLQRLVANNFLVLWDYRFLYRELIALLRRDEVLQRRYQEVRQRGFTGFEELFAAFVAAGVLRQPASSTTMHQLATLCWLISEFWLPTLEVGGQVVDSPHMQEGVDLMMEVLRPYLL
ncbi:MAG: TetR/AcrR family transcriptional regulator [Chloroflexaceae bacterium]|jgi:AcrR family transcriptional regulator|nr:TetR/AcrR family transcriptional regulator [Chloroflexaceae bacterium]